MIFCKNTFNKCIIIFSLLLLGRLGLAFDLVTQTQSLNEKIQNKSLSTSQTYVPIAYDLDVPQDYAIQVKLNNRTTVNVDINIEIKDNLSNDYWTRLNSYQTLRPGIQDITIHPGPVGEFSRPGRVINFQKIKSLILAKVDEQAKAQIDILTLQIIKIETLEKRGVKAFDFENEDGELFPGFIKVTPDSTYSKASKYGFEQTSFWRPYPNVGSTYFPDSLTSDGIYSNKGTFKVKVENTNINYTAYIGHKIYSGYWGEFPIVGERTIKINDRLAYSTKTDRHQTAENYFTNQDRYFNHLDQVYKQIVKTSTDHIVVKRIKPVNNEISLSWMGHDCLTQTCFDQALTFFVLVPETSQHQSFVNWLDSQRLSSFNKRFSSDPDYFNFLQTEFIKLPIKITTKENKIQHFSNQRQMITFEIAASDSKILKLFQEKRQRQQIKVSAEISKYKKKLNTYIVNQGIRRTHAGSTKYTLADTYYLPVVDGNIEIEPRNNLRIGIWLDEIKVNQAKEDLEISLLVKNSHQKEDYRIPLTLISYDLPEPGLLIGPFNSNIQESWWSDQELSFRSNTLLKKSIEMIGQLGLNTFSIFPDIEYEIDSKDNLELRKQSISDHMKIAKQNGFKYLFAYNRILTGADACYGNLSDKHISQLMSQLKAKAKSEGWLPLHFILCDEPVNDQIELSITNLLKWQKHQDQQFIFSAAFSNSAEHSKYEKLFKYSAHPILNLFSLGTLEQTKKPWTYYNDVNRFSFGSLLYFLRSRSNLNSRLGWNWNNSAGDPYMPLDAREDDISWCSSSLRGDLRCHSILYNEVLKGINDLRILNGLSNQCQKFQNNSECKQFFNQLRQVSQDYLDQMPKQQQITARWHQQAKKLTDQATFLLVKLIEATKTSPNSK